MEREKGEEKKEGRREVRKKALLFISFLLVGVLSFEAGLLTKVWRGDAPLALTIVEGPQRSSSPSENAVALPGAASGSKPAAAQVPAGSEPANCPYVGSKNSDKYHIPSCSYAKRILPANRVCFASEEEAKQQGYQAGCLK